MGDKIRKRLYLLTLRRIEMANKKSIEDKIKKLNKDNDLRISEYIYNNGTDSHYLHYLEGKAQAYEEVLNIFKEV